MAKTDKSKTKISPDDQEGGEQNFVNLHRQNVNDALKSLNGKARKSFEVKTKAFDREKHRYGHDMQTSIDVYDSRQPSETKRLGKNVNDDVSEGLKTHKLFVNGNEIGVFHGEGKEAAKFAHKTLKRHGRVHSKTIKATNEEIVAELHGKGKLSDLERVYTDLAVDKMIKHNNGDYDQDDDDKHGELSLHNAMRAFTLKQKLNGANVLNRKKEKNHKFSNFDEAELNDTSFALLSEAFRKSDVPNIKQSWSDNLDKKMAANIAGEYNEKDPDKFGALSTHKAYRADAVQKTIEKVKSGQKLNGVDKINAAHNRFKSDLYDKANKKFKATESVDDAAVAAFLAKGGKIKKVETGKKAFNISDYAWKKAAQDGGKKIGAQEPEDQEPEDWQRTTARGWELAQRAKGRTNEAYTPPAKVPQRLLGDAAAKRVADIADRKGMSQRQVLDVLFQQGAGRKSLNKVGGIRSKDVAKNAPNAPTIHVAPKKDYFDEDITNERFEQNLSWVAHAEEARKKDMQKKITSVKDKILKKKAETSK